MPSVAKSQFAENKKDIDQLWSIHQDVAGAGPGRKHGVDVLNRAAIVFVTACWESYVEDLATEAFDFMLANAAVATAIPMKVRNFATKELFEQKDSRKIWDIADAGWKSLLQAHKAATLKRMIGHFNTPQTAQVNALYEELLGIPAVSSAWHWKSMTSAQAESKLDEYITIRGNIAHRTAHDETVYKNWGTDYLAHVESLVEATEKAVAQHVEGVVGTSPW
jgi:hypothetical protein